MQLHDYLAARLPVSGRPVLGRPLPPVRFGHVELLARVRSPFAGLITGDAYREPQLGDLLLALEILHEPPPHLPSPRRLLWLRLLHRRLSEGARLDACSTLAAHVNAALALPRHWSRVTPRNQAATPNRPSDTGCPWLLSLAHCQMALLGVSEELLPHKPMQLVIQQCFAAWADVGRMTLVSPLDDALRAAARARAAERKAGLRPEEQAIVDALKAKNRRR